MTHFDLLQAPQGRTETLLGLNIPASADPFVRITATRRESINFVGSAEHLIPVPAGKTASRHPLLVKSTGRVEVSDRRAMAHGARRAGLPAILVRPAVP